MATQTEHSLKIAGFNFDLKKIQKCPAMEGYCYFAEVYINNTLVGEYRDDGCGGSAYIEPSVSHTDKNYKAQSKIIKNTDIILKSYLIPPDEKVGINFVLELSFELLIGELIEAVAHNSKIALQQHPFTDKAWKDRFKYILKNSEEGKKLLALNKKLG